MDAEHVDRGECVDRETNDATHHHASLVPFYAMKAHLVTGHRHHEQQQPQSRIDNDIAQHQGMCVSSFSSSHLPRVVPIRLSYPAHWHPPDVFQHHSLYADSAAQEAVEWLIDHELVPVALHHAWMARVRAMNVRTYGGASLVLGNYAHTLLHTKMVLLWLLWDDVIVEHVPATDDEVNDMEKHERHMNHIMHGRVVIDPNVNRKTLHDRFAFAWQEIMHEVRDTPFISDQFLQRFGDSFVEWMHYANQERHHTLRHAANELLCSPEIATASANERQAHIDTLFVKCLQQRKKTIGIMNTAQLMEISTGFEIPSDIWQHPMFQQLLDCAALLVGLTNELVSLGKDIDHYEESTSVIMGHRNHDADSDIHVPHMEQTWANVVLLYHLLNRVRLGVAIDQILTLHDAAIADFDRIADILVGNKDTTCHDACVSCCTLPQQQQEHVSECQPPPSPPHRNDANHAEQKNTHNTDSSHTHRPCAIVPDVWQERLRAYIYNLRLCITGFAYWHTHTPRYTDTIAVDGISHEAFCFTFGS